MEILHEIWTTASRNRLRTTLTGFAVAWGIFMLIFLLGAGNGLINAQTKQLNERLSNSMQVFGGETSVAYNGLKEGRGITLRDRDITATERYFKQNIDMVGGEIMVDSSQTVSYGSNYVSPTIRGVAPEFLKIEKCQLLEGRFINPIDMREKRKVIIISKKMQRELTPGSRLPGHDSRLLGKYIKVNSFAFKVVGIYKEDESRQEMVAYTPFTTFKTIYNRGDQVGSIVFTFHGITDDKENDAFEKAYRRRINANHDASPDDESALWLWNRYSQSMDMEQGIGIIRTALWIIGLLTLLSGIVGISNIMLITVKERTHEFGIRKALGAKPRSILRLIILESIITTAFFGYVGMLCGIAVNEYMDATIGHKAVDAGVFRATMFLNPTVGLDVCIETTLVMIVAGTIAGIIPARKAAKIRPIEALNSK